MNIILFYDTETTGLPLFKESSSHPAQPHIVQLGACLVDADTQKTVATLDVIVKPDGWVIPDEVSKIHGITTEHAMDVGISEVDAVKMLIDLQKNFLRVGHNEQFDARIVHIACKRFFGEEAADHWKSRDAQCTARMSTKILNLPPTPKMIAAGFNKAKTPNLGEAFKFFTGKELQGAHSAIVDVNACKDVYFHILDKQIPF